MLKILSFSLALLFPTVACAKPSKPDPTFLVTTKGQKAHQKLEQLPLRVGMKTSGMYWAGEAAAAVEYWNTITGIELFKFVDVEAPDEFVAPEGAILISATEEEVCGDEDGCKAVTTMEVDQASGEIQVLGVEMPVGLIHPMSAFLMMTHELGHCLGLAHDENTKSIMHPSATSSDQTASDADVAALRFMYTE